MASMDWLERKAVGGSKTRSWSAGDAGKPRSCFATIWTESKAVSKFRWDVLCMKSHHSTQAACGTEGREKTLKEAMLTASSALHACRTKTGFSGLRRKSSRRK